MFLVLTIAISLLISGVNSPCVPIQDITGGGPTQSFARPNDPEVRQGSASRAASQAIDQVEDALEVGNFARNANPPRYHDAEVAYRLAVRLNPKDPRPLMGLGNIWYDQKQYAAAAKIYQEALSMTTAMASFGVGTFRGQLAAAEQRHFSARLRGSIGLTLFRTFDFAKAQAEFETALKAEPTNAQWHALRGCTLLRQGNKPEAVKAFQEAMRLDPANPDYQQLLHFAQQ